MEVLNEQIRTNKNIRGLKIKGEDYKLQAFADDLVFILEEPSKSIDELMVTLTNFGEIVEKKVNI